MKKISECWCPHVQREDREDSCVGSRCAAWEHFWQWAVSADRHHNEVSESLVRMTKAELDPEKCGRCGDLQGQWMEDSDA